MEFIIEIPVGLKTGDMFLHESKTWHLYSRICSENLTNLEDFRDKAYKSKTHKVTSINKDYETYHYFNIELLD